MLDLSTVRVACTIRNTGALRTLVLTGRHLACMFQRVTVRVKGVITDDVSYYHRLVGTLMNLRPLNSLYSDGPSQLGTGYSDYTQSGVQERWRHCGCISAPSQRHDPQRA
jgi:hypothetical protein